jgi:hypothetical protein
MQTFLKPFKKLSINAFIRTKLRNRLHSNFFLITIQTEYCDHEVYYSVRHFSIFGIAGISTPDYFSLNNCFCERPKHACVDPQTYVSGCQIWLPEKDRQFISEGSVSVFISLDIRSEGFIPHQIALYI